MSEYVVTDTDMISVANAIRSRGGTSSSLVFPNGFVGAIQSIPSGGSSVTEVTISDNGSVTQALDPGDLYHFTGTLTALTIILNAPASGQLAHYHFDFDSGSTAPTLTLPNTVTMPSGFTVEASKHYEIDILNDYGTVMSW